MKGYNQTHNNKNEKTKSGVAKKTLLKLSAFLPNGVLTKNAYLLYAGDGSSAIRHQLQSLEANGYVKKHSTKTMQGTKVSFYELTVKGFEAIKNIFDWGRNIDVSKINYSGINLRDMCIANELRAMLYPIGVSSAYYYLDLFPDQEYKGCDESSLAGIVYRNKYDWFSTQIGCDADKHKVKEACRQCNPGESISDQLYSELFIPFSCDVSASKNGLYFSREMIKQLFHREKGDLQSKSYYNFAGIMVFNKLIYELYHCGHHPVYFGKQFISAAYDAGEAVVGTYRLEHADTMYRRRGILFYYTSYDLKRQFETEYKRRANSHKETSPDFLYSSMYMIPVTNKGRELLRLLLCESEKYKEIEKRYTDSYKEQIELYDSRTFYFGVKMNFFSLFKKYKGLRDVKEKNKYTIICFSWQKSAYEAIFKPFIKTGQIYVYADDARINDIISGIGGEKECKE